MGEFSCPRVKTRRQKTKMSDQHLEPLLGDDGQPSWASSPSSPDDGGASPSSSPWDQAASRLPDSDESSARNGSGGDPRWADPRADGNGDGGGEDLPRVVLLVRLGNMGAASALIFGSVECFFLCVLF